MPGRPRPYSGNIEAGQGARTEDPKEGHDQMTAARFDALLRTTATRGTSRRGLLKGMAGAALAGGGALVATSSSAASRCEDR